MMAVQRASSTITRLVLSVRDSRQFSSIQSITPRSSSSAAGSSTDMMRLHCPCRPSLVATCSAQYDSALLQCQDAQAHPVLKQDVSLGTEHLQNHKALSNLCESCKEAAPCRTAGHDMLQHFMGSRNLSAQSKLWSTSVWM